MQQQKQQPQQFRKTTNNQYGNWVLDNATKSTTQMTQTTSSRPQTGADSSVPSLPINAIPSGRQPPPTFGISRVAPNQSSSNSNTTTTLPPAVSQPRTIPAYTGPIPVGPTTIPDLQYRAPAGTKLNKIPYSARNQLMIAQNQRDTRERLRAAALDAKVRKAVEARETQREKELRAAQQPALRSTNGKGSRRTNRLSSSQRLRAEQSFVRAEDLAQLEQPYQPQPQPQQRPSSAQMLASQVLGQTEQKQSSPSPTTTNNVNPRDSLLSHSTMARLSPAELAAQPAAGLSYKVGGSNLASILGGGHETVVFGKKNAASASTRVETGVRGPASPQAKREALEAAAAYAPYATTVDLSSTSGSGSTKVFNDERTGSLVVRDDLTEEAVYAPACIGYGKRHPGFKSYLAKRASESLADRAKDPRNQVQVTDPFAGGNVNILSWNTDGIERKTGKEELQRMREKAWSKTSGDYGATFKPHVHGPNCGHASAIPVHPFASSANNPLNPSGADGEVATWSTNEKPPPEKLAAAALGYGRKHSAYKTHILGAVAPKSATSAAQ